MLRLNDVLCKYSSMILQSIPQTVWMYADDTDFTILDSNIKVFNSKVYKTKRDWFNNDVAFYKHQTEIRLHDKLDFIMEYSVNGVCYHEHIYYFNEEFPYYFGWLSENRVCNNLTNLDYLFNENFKLFDQAILDINLTTGFIETIYQSIPLSKQCVQYQDFIECFAKERIEESYQFSWLEEYTYNSVLNYFKTIGPLKRQEVLLLNDNYEYKWVEMLLNFVVHPGTNEIWGRFYIIDKDKEIREYKYLQYQVERDCLTGLYNRKACEFYVNQWTKKYPFHKHAFMIIDIDRFKHVNDRYGHFVGDQVLIAFGQLFMNIFRKEDVKGRIGGDEFVVFLKNVNSEQVAKDKANELRTKAHQLLLDMQITEKFTVSIGLAVANQNGSTYEELLEYADQNLYIAKNNGKDQVVLYNQQ